MNKLKYANYYVGFQEVPNEISLCINISGCPHKCEGCHSQYLWEYVGNYVSDDIDKIINKYNYMITCVCFMGGDQNLPELIALIHKVKEKYKLKICIYTGCDELRISKEELVLFNYIKLGRFIEELGGLKESTTNQRFYKVSNKELVDITKYFQNTRSL
jgi:anaerobic ribonucleoside-triphosphate reductase activating protein